MGNRSHTIYLGLQNNIVFVKIYGTESTLKKYEAESTLMEQTQHLRYTRTLNTNKDIWNKINT